MKDKKQKIKNSGKQMLTRILANAIRMSARQSGGKTIYTDTIDVGFRLRLE